MICAGNGRIALSLGSFHARERIIGDKRPHVWLVCSHSSTLSFLWSASLSTCPFIRLMLGAFVQLFPPLTYLLVATSTIIARTKLAVSSIKEKQRLDPFGLPTTVRLRDISCSGALANNSAVRPCRSLFLGPIPLPLAFSHFQTHRRLYSPNPVQRLRVDPAD